MVIKEFSLVRDLISKIFFEKGVVKVAKGWLYPLGGAPKPVGGLRPVMILLEDLFVQ